MNTAQLISILELGLIYGLVAIGVYLSFRILQFPDLTIDGSFPLGAAVCATLISHEFNPFLALIFAGFSGAFFGWMTSLLSSHLKILNLLSGILTMSGLYSINLRIMGNKPNISLLDKQTLFQLAKNWMPPHWPITLMIILIIIIFISLLIIGFLKSNFGLAIRAVGCNPRMAKAQGINDTSAIGMGLTLSNGCIALSGAIFSQVYHFADVTMGVGTIITGLASVIIGEAILPTRTIPQAIFACIVGAILYRFLIACALNIGDVGLYASDLNLITSLLVILAMQFPRVKILLKSKILKSNGEK